MAQCPPSFSFGGEQIHVEGVELSILAEENGTVANVEVLEILDQNGGYELRILDYKQGIPHEINAPERFILQGCVQLVYALLEGLQLQHEGGHVSKKWNRVQEFHLQLFPVTVGSAVIP